MIEKFCSRLLTPVVVTCIVPAIYFTRRCRSGTSQSKAGAGKEEGARGFVFRQQGNPHEPSLQPEDTESYSQ